MPESLDLAQLQELINTTWIEWMAAVRKVEPERMEHPHVGEWSVKDLVAHVTWSEKEMVGLLTERSLALASPHWMLPTDERNQAIYEEHRHRPLESILNEAQAVHAELLNEIQKLGQEDLHDPSRYAGMPADWIPWEILAGSTYRHYAEHAEDLEK